MPHHGEIAIAGGAHVPPSNDVIRLGQIPRGGGKMKCNSASQALHLPQP
jgi:hypothetical protein